jgi:hypothetical protein
MYLSELEALITAQRGEEPLPRGPLGFAQPGGSSRPTFVRPGERPRDLRRAITSLSRAATYLICAALVRPVSLG